MLGRFDVGSLGARGAVHAWWAALGRTDPNLSGVRVCVDVFLGDRRIRAAVEPVRATSGTSGEVAEYRPILDAEPEIDLAVELGSRAAVGRSISVSMRALDLGLGGLLADRKPLGGQAEVSLVVDGMDHDLRLVVMRGVVEGGVTFRREGEPLTLTISDPVETSARLVPPFIVETASWVNAHESAIGARIARVYNSWNGVPALRVRDLAGPVGPLFAVCDDPDRLTVSEVRVNGVVKASGDATYPWSEVVATSARGERILAVDFSSATTWADSDTVHVSVVTRNGVRTLGILDVVEHLLRSTDLGPAGLRHELFAASATRIGATSPAVMVNASGAEAINVREVIAALLDGWPALHLVYEGGGLGPVPLDRRGEPVRDVSAVLVGGEYPLLDRGVVSEAPRAVVVNDLEVRYEYDTVDDRFLSLVRRDASNSARAALSESLVGRRTDAAIALPFVAGASDASAAADWLVEHFALPWYYVEWVCPAGAFLRFRRGQSVTYTDPDLVGLTAVRALVVRVAYRRGQTVLGLLAWP